MLRRGRGWGRWALWCGALVSCALGSACVANPVGPVGSIDAYREKASSSIGDAISAVGTVQLVGTAEREGSSYASFSVQVADDSLDAIRTAQDTFETIVPPDAQSEQLRPRVLDALADSRRGVSDVATALQLGGSESLAASLAGLDELAAELDALQHDIEGAAA